MLLPLAFIFWCLVGSVSGIGDISNYVGFEVFEDALMISEDNTLAEWTPIRATIGINETLRYQYDVNHTVPGVSSSFEIIVFISGAICKLPDSWDSTQSYNGLSVYYTFNSTLNDVEEMNRITFENGYVQGLARANLDSTSSELYIVIKPDSCPECPANSTWTYDFGLSQDDLTFQFDNSSVVTLADTDYNSFTLSCEDLAMANQSVYDLYVFESDKYTIPAGLSESWSAVAESDDYSIKAPLNSTWMEGERKFISINGLKKSTNYTGVVLETFSNAPYGGTVFKTFQLETLESEACKVIYGLNFCSDISYAVPVSSNFSAGTQSLKEMITAYDNEAQRLYEPFNYAMQQIACDAHLDTRYSPIRTCEDCRTTYKEWLCAVTIPRCSTKNGSTYRHYEAGEGRNEFVANTINPPLDYYEILPCIGQCRTLVRDCPADFNFACPRKELLSASYCDGATIDSKGQRRCNLVGGSSYNSGVSLKPTGYVMLALVTFILPHLF